MGSRHETSYIKRVRPIKYQLEITRSTSKNGASECNSSNHNNAVDIGRGCIDFIEG